MLYFTQIIFIKPGQEQVFDLFESKVLPLLNKYNGELIYRIRPAESCVIATSIAYPYELHLITFASKNDFEAYRDDKERQQYMPLKEASVENSILIAGSAI